jgi:energy-coupling factor transport system permease protein
MWHPASLLLAWLGFALALQWVSLPWQLALAAVSIVLAGILATKRCLGLLKRSRWLLLSLCVLFLFVTPGAYLPGIWGRIGLTYEGLHQGGEQLSRLLAMLSSLALLHERIGTRGLLAAFYWWLGPFAWRKTTVVRLMLVLEFVEQRRKLGWREWLVPEEGNDERPGRYSLGMPPLRLHDVFLMAVLLTAGLIWVVAP